MFESRRIGLALVLPALIFIVVGFILPVGVLLGGSFRIADSWTFDAYARFFAGDLNREVFWRTVRLGVLVTGVSAVVGYAVAFAIVDAGLRWRGRLIGLMILPLMISPVARTYAWIVILGRSGLFNSLIVNLGLTDEPIRLLFTETAVFIGLVQLFLPLMILSLVSALENLPADVIPAARVLGANWLAVFVRVILPLTREGLIVGGTLVFTGAVTAYITPAVLGGSRVLMLETLLYQRINVANDVLSASVIAVILVVMTYIANVALRRLGAARAA
jgi:putative spermidine/putrescine transport system permease protein